MLELLRVPVYFQVLLRSMRIAASVTLLSLLLGFPLAYYVSFQAGKKKDLLYQLGHHSAVGQLSGAGVCMEDHPGQRRRVKHVAAVLAHHPAIRRDIFFTVRWQ